MAVTTAVEACVQCERIIDLCDELPDEAEEFGDSITDKTNLIWRWIEEHNHVTAKQQEALDNMESGVRKWLHDDD